MGASCKIPKFLNQNVLKDQNNYTNYLEITLELVCGMIWWEGRTREFRVRFQLPDLNKLKSIENFIEIKII